MVCCRPEWSLSGLALGLRRSARLPVLAALHTCLKRPILLVTDRADHALTLFDELACGRRLPSCYLFPEPNPLFYEEARLGRGHRAASGCWR